MPAVEQLPIVLPPDTLPANPEYHPLTPGLPLVTHESPIKPKIDFKITPDRGKNRFITELTESLNKLTRRGRGSRGRRHRGCGCPRYNGTISAPPSLCPHSRFNLEGFKVRIN